jgi:hypothetical protein
VRKILDTTKGRNGTGALLEIIADAEASRVPPVARGILDVLARQYSALGAEIGSIDRSIVAWHVPQAVSGWPETLRLIAQIRRS